MLYGKSSSQREALALYEQDMSMLISSKIAPLTIVLDAREGRK